MFDDNMVMNLPVPHEDGSFISQKVSRVVEIIRDYDHNIDVRWIPPNQRGAEDPAFAIVGKDIHGREYVIFYVQDESQFDGRVLERLFQMDQAKNGNVLSDIDAKNAAVRAIRAKLHQEQLEEAHDLAQSILKSKKHTYRHDGVKYE